EAILHPATARLLAGAGGELRPEIIDLRLILATHVEGDGFGELELRPGVEPHELLTLELEAHAHGLAVRPRRDLDDLGILEDRDVEPHGLLGLVVEPQERGDLLHVAPFRSAFMCARMRRRGARRGGRGSGCSRRAPALRSSPSRSTA